MFLISKLGYLERIFMPAVMPSDDSDGVLFGNDSLDLGRSGNVGLQKVYIVPTSLLCKPIAALSPTTSF